MGDKIKSGGHAKRHSVNSVRDKKIREKNSMNRYSKILDKMPREFVLLQGTGCKWQQCTFCDYHTDVSDDPFEVNRQVLEQVTGEYGVLDVINSGSAFELDDRTIDLLQRIIVEKNIHTLWCEMHWMYRNRLQQFADRITSSFVKESLNDNESSFLILSPKAQRPSVLHSSFLTIKYRCGIETFNPQLRQQWRKGVPLTVTPEDVAQYFQGICLLCCVEGQTKDTILKDIELAQQHFEYFSVNLFCNNTTAVRRDESLVKWFIQEVYPTIKDNPKIEILIENSDLGVG